MTGYLELIEHNTRGPRCDVTPVFANYAAFSNLVADLAQLFAATPVDSVAGIDALGFILGTALALHYRVGFVALRKGGKLPGAVGRVAFVDYSGQAKALELRAGALAQGARVLLVDEWIETGAQARAGAALIERQGAVVAGIASIHIDLNAATRPLLAQYNCQALEFDE